MTGGGGEGGRGEAAAAPWQSGKLWNTQLCKNEAKKDWNVGHGDERVKFLFWLIVRCRQERSKNGTKTPEIKMFLAPSQHRQACLDTPTRSESWLSASAPRWPRVSQTARTQILRLHRRQAVNIFIKCDLASICCYGSLMWPSGAGHQRTGWMPGTAGIMKANARVSECTERL